MRGRASDIGEFTPQLLSGSLMSESPNTPSFASVRGEAAVLAQHGALLALAERTGQHSTIAHIEFMLSAHRFKAKVPHLLTLAGEEGELRAAIFLYEYCPWGVPTRIFVPADYYGLRNVLAPPEMRSAISQQAAHFLIERGACLVLITIADGKFPPDSGGSGLTCATYTRELRLVLPLRSTVDETFAALGTRTRRNLRHFRRRAESELGATFHPVVEVSEAEFLKFNLRCAFPVSPSVASWRFRSVCGTPSGLLVGVRAADGSWLSLLGGRHHMGTTFVDWLMNLDSLPSFSLGTVIRSYLIEFEVARKAQFLHFEGGTRHSMREAFLKQEASGLLLARPFLSPPILRSVLPRVMPKNSILAKAIAADSLIWH